MSVTVWGIFETPIFVIPCISQCMAMHEVILQLLFTNSDSSKYFKYVGLLKINL